MKKLRSNKPSEKYFYKQEVLSAKYIYSLITSRALSIFISLHIIRKCYTVYKQSCTKYFFIFYSGQHILLCDQKFISTGYV